MILDSSYDLVKMIRPIGSLSGTADMHEFRLADGGRTALMTVYQTVPYDLSPFGITNGLGWIVEAVFQEVLVSSGEVVFEWRSLDHEETSPAQARKVLPGNTLVGGFGTHPVTPWDYFHINSIDKDADGDYLISSRHFSSLFKLSRTDGHIIWQLSGDTPLPYQKDFNFSSQHDARYLHNNATHSTISLFDNASDAWRTTATHSRGLIITLNHAAHTATLLSSFAPPTPRPHNQTAPLLSGSQGNIQLLPNHHAFIGWGEYPFFSEHAPSGAPILWGAMARNTSFTMHYRAQKFNWSGTPREDPALFAYSLNATPAAGTVFHASWNGATEVAAWRFYLAAAADGPWALVGSAPKAGFETRFRAAEYGRWGCAEAVDGRGRALRRSTVGKTFVPAERLRGACGVWGCEVAAPVAQPSQEELDAMVKLGPGDVDWESVGWNDGVEGLRPLPGGKDSGWEGWTEGVEAWVVVGVGAVVVVVLAVWAGWRLAAGCRGYGLGERIRGTYQKVGDREESK